MLFSFQNDNFYANYSAFNKIYNKYNNDYQLLTLGSAEYLPSVSAVP